MRMPPHDFEPPSGFVIHNGQPVRSDHATTVDEWAMYLAAVAYPRLPHLLTGGGPAGSVTGWYSTSTSFTGGGAANSVVIPILVPPFTKYMQMGVIATGKGEVRFTGISGSARMLKPVFADLHDVADEGVVWGDGVGPTGVDTNAPIVVAVADGCKLPTLQEVTVSWRTTAASWDIIIHGIMFRPWPMPAGTDMNGLATAAGSYPV